MSRLPNTRYSLLARLGDSANEPDQTAWAEFLDTYESAVLRYCKSRGLQDADARDVVQDVLLAVHHVADDWSPSGRPGSFRAWLVQTAHRTCLKKLRGQCRPDRGMGGSSVRQRLEELPTSDEVPDDEHEWQRWAFCFAASEVQREVQSTTWQAFWMTAVDDQSPAEVARRLGIRVGSVYAARCRVLARIRERVQELSRRDR